MLPLLQVGLPVNPPPASVTDLHFITDPLDQLTASVGPVFAGFGGNELAGFAVIVLIFHLFMNGLSGQSILVFFVRYGIRLLIATDLLRYYYTPGFLGLPVSIHQFFPALAEGLASAIKDQQWDQLMITTSNILSGITAEDVWRNYTLVPVSWLVQFCMWIVQALCFGSIALSYMGIGVLGLLFPLFIPFLMFPKTQLFQNCLQGLLQYSFYRVIAAALVFVFSVCLNTFFARYLSGGYSVLQFVTIIPQMVVLILANAWMILRIGAMVSDLFKGASSAASDFLGSASSTVTRAAITRGL